MASGLTSGFTETTADHPPQSPLKEERKDLFSTINMKRRRLARLVSQDELGMDAVCGSVSYSDQSKSASKSRVNLRSETKYPESSSTEVPLLRNPLKNRSILVTHLAALRLEADLHPMRLILTRLMAHPTHNRKGLFNQPVDPVALGLPDYHSIISQPMDLGTVKKGLHAVVYTSREQVADHIRLVFSNSMRYNPPHNPVHLCAKGLLEFFEDAYKELEPCVSPNGSSVSDKQELMIPPMVIDSVVSSVDNGISSGSTVSESSPDCGIPSDPQDSSSLVECNGVPHTSTGHDAHISESSMNSTIPATEAQSVIAAQFVQMQGQATSDHFEPWRSTDASQIKRKTKMPRFLPHTCHACQGRKCTMCKQGCLSFEPALLVCQGVHCGGARIRKGAVYYVSQDGQRHYCHSCYPSLAAIIPNTAENDPCRYKQDMLKRKNEEEIPEDWLTCSKCSVGVHAVCAFHNVYVHDKSTYRCPDCQEPADATENGGFLADVEHEKDSFTYISGSDVPVSMSVFGSRLASLSADALPTCAISAFIESKVRERMKVVENADKTVTVRVISDCDRQFSVPDVVRRHFRMETESDGVVSPPSEVKYRQKAITLFQKIDGLDVCIFCMYVQEYDGDDTYDHENTVVKSSHEKRVYIAYIDSVEHFRPRECRTDVYQEVLVSYLATARARGYKNAQIWACPPSRGNSFVFWNHPSSQRTPTQEKLVAWYHEALSRAIFCGVVTDVKSLFETEFERSRIQLEREVEEASQKGVDNIPCGRMLCPPLLDGDFWIDEVVRAHSTSLARNIKVRAPTEVCVWNVSPLSGEELDPCPALQVATLVKDRIMSHPSAGPFRRPVNAASMKLKNYHQIVTHPMDLGTIYSRCVMGEYLCLKDVVGDIELMVSNAKKFNPVGHFVHVKADEVFELFFQELSSLTKIWDGHYARQNDNWEHYADMSMSLDKILHISTPNTGANSSCVVIEDDRSSDGSRSMASSLSLQSSPMSGTCTSQDDDTSQGQISTSSRALFSRKSRKSRAASRRTSSKPKELPRQLDLLSDGPKAVEQKMVGEDLWLLDKRIVENKPNGPKKPTFKRRRSLNSQDLSVSIEDPAPNRRRQSWLGEEVCETVRSLRTSFFACSLLPRKVMTEAEQAKLNSFQAYASSYFDFALSKNESSPMSSPITDARHALLEFSQFRHFEFDTLRRAKFSTSMLLYYLRHANAPGVVPVCTACNQHIDEVRWHRVRKAAEKRRITKFMKLSTSVEPNFFQEELCGTCHRNHAQKDDFIPISVSMKSK